MTSLTPPSTGLTFSHLTVKILFTNIHNNTFDHDTVLDYIATLQPQCDIAFISWKIAFCTPMHHANKYC